MFTVYDKNTYEETTVYSVKNKDGFPFFLVRQGNQWMWRSAKHYITSEEIISNESND